MIGAHNSDIVHSFYNDKVKEVIDAGIIAEPFTYVPIVAGHMELVGGNALVFGKITEGYDVIAPSIETEIEYEGVTYYGGAIGEELITPKINLNVIKTLFNYITIVHLPDLYDPAKEYHIGEFCYINPDINRIYRCTKTVLGVVPVPGVASIYWDPDSLWTGFWEYQTYRKVKGRLIIYLPDYVYIDSYYYISIQNDEEDIPPITAGYKAVAGDTIADVKNGLETALSAAFIAAGLTSQDIFTDGSIPNGITFCERTRYFMQTPNYEIGDINTVYKDFKITSYILTLGQTLKFPDLKCGATHGFGIVYKDRGGRTCSVMKGGMDVYIPFYTEDPANLMESIVKLKFKIFHTPPAWAETYEIVYFGNLTMDQFLQIRIDEINLIPLSNDNRFSLNIQETLDWTRDKNNRWKVDNYYWVANDRLRLIGTVDVTSGIVTQYDTFYDYEIESTGTQYGDVIGGDYLILQAKKRPVAFVGETNILAEIYRPLKGLSQSVAYGTGMVFDIAMDVYSHKYHKGDVDQVLDSEGSCTIPAEVENTANDCWKFARLNYEHNTGNINVFWAESMFPSDWWSGQLIANKLTSCGFPFLDDLSQRQVILDERIRHGGYLIEGTRTNNIAHFTFEDFRDLQKKDGDITGLREIGYTLKIIQLHKETSIYINRIQTFNPDGTEQFTLTDTFLGTMRPMESDYGCQHPDSIMVNNRNLYYWDNNEGVFIRSAPNGQIVLDIKMKRWFKDLVRWIQLSGGADVLQTFTGANNEHDEVWITFRMGNQVTGIIFSEKQGRFISHINQITESYIHLGNFFAHLYHQTLWIMNLDEGQDWLTWVDVPTYAEIEVVSNIEPTKNKIFNAVAHVADHLLQSPAKYVNIPKEASANSTLMETNIPIWENREGIEFGEILRDENSKGNFVSIIDRKMNGNLLRGRYCFVKLRTEEHDEKVRIDSIVVFSTLSERNP